MSLQLPSWIKPHTKDAYSYAYTVSYCHQPKDIREMIDKTKEDNSFSTRETKEFFKEVARMAEFEFSSEDLKALERKEKMQGIHPSQQKKPEIVKSEKENSNNDLNISPSGENPS